MPDVIDIRFPGSVGAKALDATAKRAAALMRSETLPELRGATPELTGKLKRSWKVRKRKNTIIVSARFTGAFQKKSIKAKWWKTLREHAETIIGRAFQEVGLPIVAEEAADMLRNAAALEPNLEYRR